MSRGLDRCSSSLFRAASAAASSPVSSKIFQCWMEVLVSRDPDHDLVGDRIVRIAPGVAMGDPGRQLLERDVGESPEQARGVVVVALLELGHPPALEGDRVDVSRDRQIVPEDDRVAALLGCPASDPVHPRAVALAEHPVDQPVVAR